MDSLSKQEYKNFELIIIDQNKDTRLNEIIKFFSGKFKIIHLRSEPGLSVARNLGLKNISGDIVAFPDDDCMYAPDLLRKISDEFKARPALDGITGRCIDFNEKTNLGNFDYDSGRVTKLNVWRRGISFTIFLKKNVVERVGCFDERLGVGSITPWGAGEETDYLIRCISSGANILYEPAVKVQHPAKGFMLSKESCNNTYRYASGMGYVMRKHKYPVWFVLYTILRPIGGAIISFLGMRCSKGIHHLIRFLGRINGWFGYQATTKYEMQKVSIYLHV